MTRDQRVLLHSAAQLRLTFGKLGIPKKLLPISRIESREKFSEREILASLNAELEKCVTTARRAKKYDGLAVLTGIVVGMHLAKNRLRQT